jgi:NAD(P)-dependent dehydrogenase (short-subunit alcohol dehydrogenase family)
MEVAVVDLLPNLRHGKDAEPGLHNIRADVCSMDELLSMRGEVERCMNTVTHIVSVAGWALDGEFEALKNTKTETVHRSITLNLESHIHLVRVLIPLLEKDPGKNKSITLISSINAIRDFGLPAYSAAKAGLGGFVRSMAAELGEHGIRINAVLSGTIKSERTLRHPKDFEVLKRTTALKRLVTADEIAQLVFALSHLLTCVTGQEIVADCGQSVTSCEWRLTAKDKP